jgi:serine phosphatase RsbU (regulator of sigma subunit)
MTPSDTDNLLAESPYRLPRHIVEEVERATGGPAALYVVDIGGTVLRQVAGAAGLPHEVSVPGAIGTELGIDDAARLAERLGEDLVGCTVAPLWVRGRATCVLVASQGSAGVLERIAAAAAPVVELAAGHTDVFDRARRDRSATPAAEIQQDLLSPRRARVTGARLAASVIPAYDVGGDWFDHAENPEGVWLGVADAMGRGLRASAVSCVAIGATRAARRAGASLEQCCESVDAAIDELGAGTFVTLVLANWHAGTRTLSWINCGHPPPMLISADGSVMELEGEATHPLGLWREKREGFGRNQRRLQVGDRVMLFTDGVTDRRMRNHQMIGLEGLRGLLGGLSGCSAAETVQAVERHLRLASDEDVVDDATQLVLEVVA